MQRVESITMATPQMYRVVLSNEVTRDDIDDAMARCEVHLTNIVPKCDDIPAQLIYSADESNHLYVVEEGRLGVIYLATAGPGGHALLERIETELPSLGDAEMTRLDGLLDEDTADADAITARLATCVLRAPSAPATRSRLERALAHADREIRRAAIVSITYAPDRAFVPALMKIRDEDDDLELRTQAAHLLAGLTGENR